MARTFQIRNPRISEVLQEMGFVKTGSVMRARGHNMGSEMHCFACDCCGQCPNCYRGRTYEVVNFDVLQLPEGVSMVCAKRFVHSAMKEFG